MSEVPIPMTGRKIAPQPLVINKNELPKTPIIDESVKIPEKPSSLEKSPIVSLSELPIISTPTETITPKPVYTSTFTKDISNSLLRCGIQVDYCNPTALGEGANHKVYSYEVPDEPPRVIKIAKEQTVTSLTHKSARAESEGSAIAQETFGAYAAETEIKTDPQNVNKYFVIQKAIKGRPISNIRFKNDPQIRAQLAEIVKQNNKLYTDKKMCLDFVGMAGFTGWFKKQFKKLLLRKSEFEVSNIIEGEDGKLKIIDFEYFNLNGHIGFRKKITNFLGMTVNRILMKHYFGLDIKKR